MTRHIAGPAGSKDSRGEPYLTLCGGSVKPEGEQIPLSDCCKDEVEAWGLFLDSFAQHTVDADVVEWRTTPDIMRHVGDMDALVVRARFSAYKLPLAEDVRAALNDIA